MSHIDPLELIRTFGYIGMFGIIFAETGLLIGFFLPGDTLLFTAGFLASQEKLNIWVLFPICYIAAVIGNSVGYGIGVKAGPALFRRKNSTFFDPEHLHRASAFFDRHGGKAVVLARFVPIARTFVPVVAGAGRMPYSRFTLYNVVGAIPWTIGVTTLGYFFGHVIPDIDRYLLPVILGAILVSALPTIIRFVPGGSGLTSLLLRQLRRNTPRR